MKIEIFQGWKYFGSRDLSLENVYMTPICSISNDKVSNVNLLRFIANFFSFSLKKNLAKNYHSFYPYVKNYENYLVLNLEFP